MAQVELARMTWKQAAAARDRGAVVLIPVGTLEQNGSVCPLGTDTLAAAEIAKRVAEKSGAVVTPTIAFGYSPQFRHFPGTVSVSPDTLRSMIYDVCLNMIANGFDRLFVINCHISNEPIIEHAARDVREQLDVLMAAVNPITVAQGATKDLYAAKENTLGHGSEPIASMLRSFTPESVHMDQSKYDEWGTFQGLQAVGSSKVKVGQGSFNLFFGTDEAAETGGSGDPSASDPERGAEIMNRTVDIIADFVQAFAKLEVSEQE
jgi:creatinine amidohydrolase